MESGAGKHWTEEEVKALLSVWSEKNIRKQLHGTLRNKGIFIYIAKRLQELGVCRDWKQCRAKYKNLKYEFRTVKYAHNSGDATKTMKFFHDLDAILQYEPVTQLTEDENGRCSATERQLNISTTTENTEDSELHLSMPALYTCLVFAQNSWRDTIPKVSVQSSKCLFWSNLINSVFPLSHLKAILAIILAVLLLYKLALDNMDPSGNCAYLGFCFCFLI
uniref:Myb/SANT-like DNA-binding domain-containing protein n=1 Tax=Chrysemys picta bellii TaxID=8478 RepID=A0A8C3IPW0_CHRPI